jgi:8-oxo-dGTP pyrophosphatase MutT (NUDIX family)
MKWKILSSEYISDHQYFTARKDKCETPDGKIIDEYFVVELPGTVCGLALTEEGEVLMVKQYRHPIEETLIEIPGGFIDENETHEEAMRRELKEETGYEFSSLKEVGKIAANPGVLNNFTYLFLAQGGKKTSEQNLDKNEELEIELISLKELKQLFLDNKILQGTHNSCVFYALRELGKI